MSILMSQPRPVPVHSVQPDALAVETAWEILERYGHRLSRNQSSFDQVRLTLTSLQECLTADALFWLDQDAGLSAVEGPVALSRAWCDDFTAWLLRQVPPPQRQALRSFLDPAAKPMNPWPCSAVLVQMLPQQPSWLIALSFHPRRLFTLLDLKVIMLARRIWLNQRQKDQVDEKLRDALIGLVRCLSTTLEAKDSRTHGHSERVARIARRLSTQMCLPAAFVRDIYLAGLLHDIGKVGIREEVLQKTSPLSQEDQEHLRQHPGIGDRVLAQHQTAARAPSRSSRPPRALRRHRLSGSAARRGDPAGRPHPGGGRRPGRHAVGSPLSARPVAGTGPANAARGSRQAVGPAGD